MTKWLDVFVLVCCNL